MQEYTIQNDYIALSVLDFGLRIKEIFLKPIQQNAVLAYAENSEYLQEVNFLGATIGPNANRIKDGKFSIAGTEWNWEKNDGANNLHSGKYGLHLKYWHCSVIENRIHAKYFQEIPFMCEYEAVFSLNNSQIEVEYFAVPDAPALINMTNHSYFHLDAAATVLDYQLKLAADFYTPRTADGIPTGEIRSVAGTALDFREYKTISTMLAAARQTGLTKEGFDHNLLVASKGFRLLASVLTSRVKLDIFSDAPGFQFYTAENLISHGRRTPYKGLCIEPQYIPNSINCSYLKQPVFTGAQPFHQKTVYAFEFPDTGSEHLYGTERN